MNQNPISYAIQNLKMVGIPKEVLEKTFISLADYHYQSALSLDAAIRDTLLEGKVLIDCNLIGGTETYIPLNNVHYEKINHWTTIYRIPKQLTQNRSIVRALNIAYGDGSVVGGYSNSYMHQSSALLDAASGVLQSNLPIPQVSSAYVQVIGDNVIMVTDNLSLPSNISLRCKLEYDSNLNHLQTTSYPAFYKLVELAAKAYIYNRNHIPMDRGYLAGGADIGVYKDIIDTYSDADEQYQEYFRTTWAKVALFNDHQAYIRHLKLITGGLF